MENEPPVTLPEREEADFEVDSDNELEHAPFYDGADHECNDECDCDEIDDVNFGGDNLLKYMSWGKLEVSDSGKEVLRFLSSVMKGKSMSQTKAQDLLKYTREEPFPNPMLPGSLSACYDYVSVAHERLTGIFVICCL